jgi:exonuclease III
MAQMEALGWHDAFRWLHHRQREFTWYSPNGNNGFRLDQAFVHRCWVARLTAAAHVWGGDALVRRDVLSDHAALLIDFEHV